MTTIKERLELLATSTSSDDHDDRMVQMLLRKLGFPNAVVTCGVCYPEGKGQPLDIHTAAKQLLQAAKDMGAL